MMYTMPKNLLSICVNFALATQRFLQKNLLQTKNDGSRRRFLFLLMFGQNQTAERQNRAQPHDRRHGFVQNQR